MPAIGQVVNFRYEILEKTGEGSHFTVFRTRDKVMNRLVATKVLKAEYASDPELSARVVARARLLIPLSHPNLTKVLEADSAQDATYIAEEHVRGIDLKERIRRIAPFTVSAAVDVSLAVAQGLDYLHRNGIIHGDLRPQKVLMGPEGEVKVTGAGLGLAVGEQQDRRSLDLMRFAHYAAPETFEGLRPDERSDVYSLGIILFEMLTGSLPYDADSPLAVAMQHARDPIPSARALNAGVPRAMDGIISKALAKDPNARYQSMKEVISDLRSAQESLRIGKPLSWSPQDPTTHPLPANEAGQPREETIWQFLGKSLLLVGVVAVLVGVAFVALFRTTPPDVNVPDVIGMTMQDARTHLEQVGLGMTLEREDFNEKYDEGEIYFASPQAGEPVKKGTVVQIFLSKGPRYRKVPSVTGMSEARARQVLSDASFTVGDAGTAYSPSIPAGDVVSQSPRAGTRADRNAVVDLTVSLGPDPTLVEPTQPDASTDQSATDNAEEGKVRKLNIRFTLPEGGDAKKVEIVVKDDNGEHVEYSQYHDPGDEVSTTVNAVGQNVEVRTLVDGVEVDRQIK